MKQKAALQQIVPGAFFVGTAATVAGAGLAAGALRPSASIAASLPAVLKQIRAGVLGVAYCAQFTGKCEHGTIAGELEHKLPHDAASDLAQALRHSARG